MDMFKKSIIISTFLLTVIYFCFNYLHIIDLGKVEATVIDKRHRAGYMVILDYAGLNTFVDSKKLYDSVSIGSRVKVNMYSSISKKNYKISYK